MDLLRNEHHAKPAGQHPRNQAQPSTCPFSGFEVPAKGGSDSENPKTACWKMAGPEMKHCA